MNTSDSKTEPIQLIPAILIFEREVSTTVCKLKCFLEALSKEILMKNKDWVDGCDFEWTWPMTKLSDCEFC